MVGPCVSYVGAHCVRSGATLPADVPGWEAAYLDAIAPLRDAEWDRWQQQPKGWRHYPHDGWGYEGYNRELYQTYRPHMQNRFLHAPADANLAAEAERALGQGHVADGARACGRFVAGAVFFFLSHAGIRVGSAALVGSRCGP
jgi:hypothetical protein